MVSNDIHYLCHSYDNNERSYAVVEIVGDSKGRKAVGEGDNYQRAIYDGISKLEASQ
ncbi:hypothetical protein [Oceanobacillus sp. FSL W7-1304]|uniref:hypothetical protein n=1 Tax=Oceanobacillus sp. FSL W7-1304 TaxID=2975322 RepID=UPI0030D7E0BE